MFDHRLLGVPLTQRRALRWGGRLAVVPALAVVLAVVLTISACVESLPTSRDLATGKALLPLIDADPLADFDHDGIPNAKELCPFVWNPDGGATSCVAWTATAYQRSAPLLLTEPGQSTLTSTHRRTNEVVDIPLVNGWIDASIAAYWTLDDHVGSVAERDVSIRHVGTTAQAPDGRGNPVFAVHLDGAGHLEAPPLGSLVSPTRGLTLCLRFRLDTEAPLGNVSLLTDLDGQALADGKDGISLRVEGGKLTCELVPAGSATATQLRSKITVVTGDWHQACLILGPSRTMLGCMLDDRVVGVTAVHTPLTLSESRPLVVGRRRIGGTGWVQGLVGQVDDILVAARTMSARELRILSRSGRPLGSVRLPHAQLDFDDVRLTQATATHGAHHAPFELRGVRRHSDTVLGDVLAYWPLDGAGVVFRQANAETPAPLPKRTNVTAGWGRFGDPQGAAVMATTAQISTAQVLRASQAAFTIEAWLLLDPAASTTDRCVFEQRHASATGTVRMCLNRDGAALTCSVGASVHVTSPLPTAVDEPIGAWRHVACSLDVGRLTLYIDGAEAASESTPSNLTPAFGSWLTTSLGNNGQGSAPLMGRLDEVIVHSSAMSAAYLAGRARGIPRLRMLAHTQATATAGAQFKTYDYQLHWLNPGASGVPLSLSGPHGARCATLVSPCLGILGWWPLQGWYGRRHVDYGAGHDATAPLAPSPTADKPPAVSTLVASTAGGLARQLSANSPTTKAKLSKVWKLHDRLTLEATVSGVHAADDANLPIVSLVGVRSDDTRVALSYSGAGIAVVAGSSPQSLGRSDLGSACVSGQQSCRVVAKLALGSQSLWAETTDEQGASQRIDHWTSAPTYGKTPLPTVALRIGGASGSSSTLAVSRVRLSTRALQPDETSPAWPLTARLAWPSEPAILLQAGAPTDPPGNPFGLMALQGAKLVSLPTPAWLTRIPTSGMALADLVRSPDGRRLAVMLRAVKPDADQTRVRIFDVGSGVLLRDLVGRGWLPMPGLVWDREGALLYRTAPENTENPACAMEWRNSADLFLLDAAGATLKRVTDYRDYVPPVRSDKYVMGSADEHPVWSRDGATLYWARNQEEIKPFTGGVYGWDYDTQRQTWLWHKKWDETPYLWAVWPLDDRLLYVQRNVGAGLKIAQPTDKQVQHVGLQVPAVAMLRLWR